MIVTERKEHMIEAKKLETAAHPSARKLCVYAYFPMLSSESLRKNKKKSSRKESADWEISLYGRRGRRRREKASN